MNKKNERIARQVVSGWSHRYFNDFVVTGRSRGSNWKIENCAKHGAEWLDASIHVYFTEGVWKKQGNEIREFVYNLVVETINELIKNHENKE